MDTNSHVELKFDFLPDIDNDIDHANGELSDSVSLLPRRSSVIAVNKSHDDVAVTDSVDFEEVQPVALFVEGREKTGEHLYHLSWSFVCGVSSEANDVCIEQGYVRVDLARFDAAVDYVLNVQRQESVDELSEVR